MKMQNHMYPLLDFHQIITPTLRCRSPFSRSTPMPQWDRLCWRRTEDSNLKQKNEMIRPLLLRNVWESVPYVFYCSSCLCFTPVGHSCQWCFPLHLEQSNNTTVNQHLQPGLVCLYICRTAMLIIRIKCRIPAQIINLQCDNRPALHFTFCTDRNMSSL